jgi:hypothetical protein
VGQEPDEAAESDGQGGGAESPPDGPARRRPTLLIALIGLTAVLSAVSVAVNRSAATDRADEPEVRSVSAVAIDSTARLPGQRIACAVRIQPAPGQVGRTADETDIAVRADGCAHVVSGRQRRVLTAEQRRQADAVGRRVDQALSRVALDPSAPLSDHVGALQAALRVAGYRDTVVRLARPDDTMAVPGSVVYAVGDGPFCLLGYRIASTGTVSEHVDGRLPDGRCLAA